jgi:uncharacterized protein (TIGR02145 family)
MISFFGRVAATLSISLGLSAGMALAAPVVKDSRDGQSYKTMPSGQLNWFTSNVSLKGKSDFKDKSKTDFYKRDSWGGLCPEGTHLPNIGEWNDLGEGKFMGSRKKQNAKIFAGKTRGYYDLSQKNPKIQGKDAAYFAIAGNDGTQAMMLDLKRGSFQMVRLPKTAALAVRCVGERDLLA